MNSQPASTTPSTKKVMLSAIAPSNKLTIGNYLGALKNWVELQKQYDCVFFAVDLHAMISSFCFFRMSNRHTFGALFGRDLVAADQREHYRTMLGDMVIAYLTAERAAD